VDRDVALDAGDFLSCVVTLLTGSVGVLHALPITYQEAACFRPRREDRSTSPDGETSDACDPTACGEASKMSRALLWFSAVTWAGRFFCDVPAWLNPRKCGSITTEHELSFLYACEHTHCPV
jgi:hypothetical protein